MAKKRTRASKIVIAVLAGMLVSAIAAGVHMATLPIEPKMVVPCMVGDFIAGLTAIIVCLAIQLKQEEVHYQVAMERVAIISELNHHVRNAVFPMCLALQSDGKQESAAIVNGAIDRLNIALQDATADAISGRTQYTQESATESAA